VEKVDTVDHSELQEYQNFVEDSRICKDNRVIYPILGLAAEVGEVVEIAQKKVRKNDLDFEPMVDKFRDELGDVLWYVAAICNDMGITLDEVIEHNIQKLNERRYGKAA
jgi:NTP pyrophosphatase (non-canonical NTP hydrolase)